MGPLQHSSSLGSMFVFALWLTGHPQPSNRHGHYAAFCLSWRGPSFLLAAWNTGAESVDSLNRPLPPASPRPGPQRPLPQLNRPLGCVKRRTEYGPTHQGRGLLCSTKRRRTCMLGVLAMRLGI
ncbi:hypothetical protein GE09DRAFT_217339 [Coniochaeta sp. 2T2.1]|nr:hypothetical protein GE09DRAFT_217339 [Coniochaeta sp. 2T2.1]